MSYQKLNITGPVDDVSQLVEKAEAKWAIFSVLDQYPAYNGKADINVEIHDDYLDDLYDMCEELGLGISMV